MPISTIGSNSLNQTSDLTINGQTVGKGGGNVATNTVHGAGAMAATATGRGNIAFGVNAGAGITSGETNIAIGSGVSGLCNAALQFATAASNNVAIGPSALQNTTGSNNIGIGNSVLASNSSGANNVGVGYQTLLSNTTASNNTAVGYQAGYTNTTGPQNTFIGHQSGYNTNNATGYNTFVGRTSGYSNTTGYQNTFFGGDAGYYVTTGNKNTILGMYNGNQGGLDIRTASNYIVLSDGDGNPRIFNSNDGVTYLRNTASATDGVVLIGQPSGGSALGALSIGSSYGAGGVGDITLILQTTASKRIYVQNRSAGVYLSDGGTSWTSNSDERIKKNLVPIEDAVNKVSQLRAVIGEYVDDELERKRPFLIAQDVNNVLPEAVDKTNENVWGVSYTDVIPLLVASIKELKTIVDAQAAEIAELKAKVA
jgi:hypothetical protein